MQNVPKIVPQTRDLPVTEAKIISQRSKGSWGRLLGGDLRLERDIGADVLNLVRTEPAFEAHHARGLQSPVDQNAAPKRRVRKGGGSSQVGQDAGRLGPRPV